MTVVLMIVYGVGIWSLVLVVLGLANHRSSNLEWSVGASSWHRVLAVIPAHNEENVVLDTIESALRGGCDVVVVADACTDRTVERVRGAGEYCYEVERHNKGAALNEFFLSSLLPEGYEAVTVLDCGAVVAPGYAERVLASLVQYDVVQGWLMPGGRRSWVNTWYAWSAYLFHAIARGRELLHLGTVIGGSAFAWRRYLHIVFDERCLTEDVELGLRLHREGRRVGYVDLGQVIDEKPCRLSDSLRQRLRWARGNWWLVLHGYWFTWRLDDAALVIQGVTAAWWAYCIGWGVIHAPFGVLAAVILYIFFAFVASLSMEDRPAISWSLLVSIPLMTMLEGLVSVYALVTVQRKSWGRTPHYESVNSAGVVERERKDSASLQ